MKARPYVGVTGFTRVDEIEKASAMFESSRFDDGGSSHLPMFGFLVSDVTLAGERVENINYRDRYPRVEGLNDLLEAVPDWGFPTIHYNTHGEGRKNLAEEIAELGKRVDFSKIGGFQFNVYVPPVFQIHGIKRVNLEKKIIFQASSRVIDKHPNGAIVDLVGVYGKSIDYVLIDRSSGGGNPIDVGSSIDLYRKLSSVKDLSIVFAGGLDGAGVKRDVDALVRKLGTKNISIDAENGLRRGGGIDSEFMGEYISSAGEVLCS
tara:strand:- start:553 stop:1341 length:789 start_codon:yes stop_codon:yes gene_type:complete